MKYFALLYRYVNWHNFDIENYNKFVIYFCENMYRKSTLKPAKSSKE